MQYKSYLKTAGVALATYSIYKRFAPSGVKKLIEG